MKRKNKTNTNDKANSSILPALHNQSNMQQRQWVSKTKQKTNSLQITDIGNFKKAPKRLRQPIKLIPHHRNKRIPNKIGLLHPYSSECKTNKNSKFTTENAKQTNLQQWWTKKKLLERVCHDTLRYARESSVTVFTITSLFEAW